MTSLPRLSGRAKYEEKTCKTFCVAGGPGAFDWDKTMTEEYSITSEERGGTEIYTLRNGEVAHAMIAPAWGNNCFEFMAGESVLEPVPFDEFSRKPGSYGVPILFPFPNRVRDGAFEFRGETYTADPPRHGFVRDKAWNIVDSGAALEDGAWIRCGLDANDYLEEILQRFPFPFYIEVTYRLKGTTLSMETVIENIGETDLPFGFGIHPYFRRPERASLQVPAKKIWELKDFLPTGNIIEAKGRLDLRQPSDLEGLELDDIYTDLISEEDGQVECKLSDIDSGKSTIVSFDGKGFPHVVAYTAPPPRHAVAIEPYTCPTDAFNLSARGVESDLIILSPGGKRNFLIRISSSETSPRKEAG